jgi:hypothetical protein
MPQRRPAHPVRPPLDKKPVPQWHCTKNPYPSEAAADAALGILWSQPGRLSGRPMEAHVYQCPRHNGRRVWHLTKQDPEGRTA